MTRVTKNCEQESWLVHAREKRDRSRNTRPGVCLLLVETGRALSPPDDDLLQSGKVQTGSRVADGGASRRASVEADDAIFVRAEVAHA